MLVLVLLTGLAVILYPTVSDYWNSLHQSRAIASYSEAVAKTAPEDYTEQWESAIQYNIELTHNPNRYIPSIEETERYNSLLNIGGTGIMGYIEIPSIQVSLPLYHGTDDSVLQIAVGHIEGTSLPTGGPGTHAVFSGHRGLPSAKLFTNLDRLTNGDIFFIRVLDEIMTYEVDQQLTVVPEDLSALDIDPEMDYVTLVTCTPYGINTHRLLVRGHRIENIEESKVIRVIADATQLDDRVVAVAIAVPILAVMFLCFMLFGGRGRRYI